MTLVGPNLSIVVPTRNRTGPLAACLAALEAQTASSFEVVVVDDGSADPEAVAAVVAGAPHARLVTAQGRGPAAARNAGAAAARAPLLFFTDDDCRPEPAWLVALSRRLDEGAHAVAGPTRNGRPNDVYATASQAITNYLVASGLRSATRPPAALPIGRRGPSRRRRFAVSIDLSTAHPERLVEESAAPGTGRVAFAPTSNLACSTDVHRSLSFDEQYPLAAGEDRDWCARLADRGIDLLFDPAAVVVHHQDLSLRGFWRQQVRYGRGAYRCLTGTGPRPPPPSAGFYVGLLRNGFAHGPRVGGLVILAQVGTATGVAREAFVARRLGFEASQG